MSLADDIQRVIDGVGTEPPPVIPEGAAAGKAAWENGSAGMLPVNPMQGAEQDWIPQSPHPDWWYDQPRDWYLPNSPRYENVVPYRNIPSLQPGDVFDYADVARTGGRWFANDVINTLGGLASEWRARNERRAPPVPRYKQE